MISVAGGEIEVGKHRITVMSTHRRAAGQSYPGLHNFMHSIDVRVLIPSEEVDPLIFRIWQRQWASEVTGITMGSDGINTFSTCPYEIGKLLSSTFSVSL